VNEYTYAEENEADYHYYAIVILQVHRPQVEVILVASRLYLQKQEEVEKDEKDWIVRFVLGELVVKKKGCWSQHCLLGKSYHEEKRENRMEID
jgi:hypothetical protein